MTQFKNRQILLGVTGSIAAYKSVELVSELRKLGAEVRIIMTDSAQKFIQPLSFEAFCPQQVFTGLWADPMAHIHLAKWAELIVVAPASANCLAKMARGLADDLLHSTLLASRAPIALAPAMNQAMWAHPATEENRQKLLARGVHFLGPDSGLQACGDVGEGRMMEGADILDALPRFWATPFLKGKTVLITAGPTEEAWDPVRYLTNKSSGKMGYALARAAYYHGAKVILISGPTALPAPAFVEFIAVTSAEEMRIAVLNHAPRADLFISAAAVSDFRFEQPLPHKLKKSKAAPSLRLVKTPDILSELAHWKERPLLVGFAAETEHLLEHAKAKLQQKNLDFIIANQVGKDLCFGQDEQEVFVLGKNNSLTPLPKTNKLELASQILRFVDGV